MSARGWLIAALLLLQGTDVFLTWRLLSSRPDVVEANPVAVRVLDAHGWMGAILLKAASTTVALGCVLVISRTRPAAGRVLLASFAALMLGVVGYSSVLLARQQGPDDLNEAASRRVEASLDRQWATLNELSRHRNEVCRRLLAGRVGLPEAVEEMAGPLRENLANLSPKSRATWPDPDRPEQIALFLVVHCGMAHKGAARPASLGGVRDQLAYHYPEAEQRARQAIGPLSWQSVSESAEARAE